MIRFLMIVSLLLIVGCASVRPQEAAPVRRSAGSGPLRLCIIGMTHGHVEGVLSRAAGGKEIQIVGVYEPKRAVFDKLAGKYHLDSSLWFDDLGRMLDQTKPEAASVMTSIKDHLMAVEACAPRGMHVLLEKPLAFSNGDARRMAELSRRYGVLVLTNYETSWYASNREAKRMAAEMGPLRKMVFRHGHKGPKEIGCSPEFLEWLTDPEQNGGGAIVDFGCYGAVLATWMMDGQRPTSVVASAGHLKPVVYPNVDDDATIVLTYPGATAVIEASWCWTHDNKEMDLFAERGAIYAGKWNDLAVREPNQPARKVETPGKPAELENEWVYLRKVVRGECAVDPLSSLEMNLVVVEILDAARAEVRAK